ncbi:MULTISPECIES: MerR family transcriptional regulator [Pseudomonas]|jgi:Predicted transcriptional regulators|uniref:Putative transcription factor, MerR family n=1 Tax=Pseudomonas brassicacearum (strain NFM421) TaxID=994484 RepID=F2KDP2_PSEBN|nr:MULTISPECIES: MerR family transcriptional regulator [Pseudomonas]EIK70258.1 transcriptional regulator, MerR family [Pseudomonas fluorescens Q8r1-96]KIR13555.1 Mercuric resistance operon regulatory protein [Pseudomonas fluorescens]AEA66820.1 Putative transcription factor, MerR family [Pseudomonas brassicacearum subsp. brassicacearum NFM421]ALQ01272.1 transcriptional regulator, MerR family [Pseudomonas brassicacearum]AOS39593.1 MerR family transcriptional regulator [Pseudomonas brassicacearum
MRIGELAQACAVSRDTLRFYEQRGLIAATRSANGYRDYPADVVQLVLYIKTAQRLGFTLGEIGASVAALWNAPDPDCAVTQLLQDKLNLIETRITELDALRHELKQRLGQRCPLNP